MAMLGIANTCDKTVAHCNYVQSMPQAEPSQLVEDYISNNVTENSDIICNKAGYC